MKTLRILSVAIVMVLGLGSCEKWVREELNVDPNNPVDVGLPQLLPAIQAGYAYLQGGDMGRFCSLFTQHHAGVDRQHAGYDIYIFTESEVNNCWNSLYEDVLMELNIMEQKAGNDNPYYHGIANTISAMVIMQVSDLHDAIPYSEAFQGVVGNYDPAFDSQESIYNSIYGLLSEAHELFMMAEDANLEIPGEDDLFYGGDIALWLELAHSLDARAHLHLGKMGNSHYVDALASIDMGALSSNGSNAVIGFYDDATGSNPLGQFMDQRGDIAMGKALIDIMNGTNDPRRDAYAGDTLEGGIWVGSGAGEFNTSANYPGPFYASFSSPVILMSYAEAKFIEAEAAFKTGDLTRAATAHNEAVVASLEMYGASDVAFETAHASFDNTNITLEEIMTQKYVHMYTNPESWSDWRRTNIPALSPADGAVIPNIPRIWPHAQDERLYNDNFPGDVQITDRVWWDIE
ncbi:MAG: SusD/RagB family nutrient-binding outer membrane lipoprotein [Flavobacteriales bacterium]|nr:SusD/RagB family nutrient-binding outer membrane lipoprotein [Flavobacteriales bacterium]